MEIITKLHRRHLVNYSKIAVITPYRAQKALIREVMDKEGFKENERPCVITIMESQGTHSFCPIESLVRSALNILINNTGLLVLPCSIMVQMAKLAEGSTGHFSP